VPIHTALIFNKSELDFLTVVFVYDTVTIRFWNSGATF